jgi:hypothetical protein
LLIDFIEIPNQVALEFKSVAAKSDIRPAARRLPRHVSGEALLQRGIGTPCGIQQLSSYSGLPKVPAQRPKRDAWWGAACVRRSTCPADSPSCDSSSSRRLPLLPPPPEGAALSECKEPNSNPFEARLKSRLALLAVGALGRHAPQPGPAAATASSAALLCFDTPTIKSLLDDDWSSDDEVDPTEVEEEQAEEEEVHAPVRTAPLSALGGDDLNLSGSATHHLVDISSVLCQADESHG